MATPRKYVVLKIPKPPTTLMGAPRSTGTNYPPAPLQAEVYALDEKQANELKRDAGYVTAPVMPLKLIAPMGGALETLLGAQDVAEVPWGLEAVGATRTRQTGSGVTVAVLDTGIDRAHEAFKHLKPAQLVEQDFTDGGNGDSQGHGTHCAGTIFGSEVKGRRIGVAPGIERALIGKVIGKGASTATLINALQWALSQGAHVIAMSLGIDFPGLSAELQERYGMDAELATSKALEGYRDNLRLFDSMTDLVRRSSAFGKPSILVAAAGNESKRRLNPDHTIAVSPPAVGEGVVAVAAVDRAFHVAEFSNTGAMLAAPGVDVLSANIGGGVVSMSGTSMAAPHVAGVAALWFEFLADTGGRITMDIVTRRLVTHAKNIPGASEGDVGNGFVQAP